MKFAFIASYGPRKCGIATFTGNTFSSIAENLPQGVQNENFVVALTDPGHEYDYPPEVKFEIAQNNLQDYFAAAKFINESGADIVMMEHEFGIYGGNDGAYILQLLRRLNMPVISVLHTVLKDPSASQKEITNKIISLSAKTLVMTEKAKEFLIDIYETDAASIEIIEHGIPVFNGSHEAAKKRLGLTGKKVLLTFGLIGRNKGVECALKAISKLVQSHPDLLYVVLGKTHPGVVRHEGEQYREYLESLTGELGLSENVVFVNEFTDEKKLKDYLTAADIYITPYLNEAQITSGTLCYAVGAGCAVVSTPYWHAAELLTEEKGRLFPFNDHAQLAGRLSELLDNPALLNKLRTNAAAWGKTVGWPRIGKRYVALAESILSEHAVSISKNTDEAERVLPAFSLEHIRRMTDSTGLIQHAKYGIPNFKEGYCLDDNARGLLMAVMAWHSQKHLQALELVPTYLSYIHYMQKEDGMFRNFLSFNRNFLDETGSEDSFGRTIWALGYLLQHPTTRMHRNSALEIFMQAKRNFEGLRYIRSIANTVIGISHYLSSEPEDADMKRILAVLAGKLTDQYHVNKHDEWNWFEQMLTYDNAILPLAMLQAGEVLDDTELIAIGRESAEFLRKVTCRNGYLSVIGNENWFAKNESQSIFAQQPVDAMMMVLLFAKLFEITKDARYAQLMQKSFMWFHGENDMQVALYDCETKGCFDGLESYGVNSNQGAESTLAYLISYLSADAHSRMEVAESRAAV